MVARHARPGVVAKAASRTITPSKLPKSINSPYSLKSYANNVTKGTLRTRPVRFCSRFAAPLSITL